MCGNMKFVLTENQGYVTNNGAKYSASISLQTTSGLNLLVKRLLYPEEQSPSTRRLCNFHARLGISVNIFSINVVNLEVFLQHLTDHITEKLLIFIHDK